MSYGNTGRFLSERYHAIRRKARETTFSIDEWSDIDIERYDLETVDFDRKQKRSSYITEVQIDAEGAAQGGKDFSDDVIDGK